MSFITFIVISILFSYLFLWFLLLLVSSGSIFLLIISSFTYLFLLYSSGFIILFPSICLYYYLLRNLPIGIIVIFVVYGIIKPLSVLPGSLFAYLPSESFIFLVLSLVLGGLSLQV